MIDKACLVLGDINIDVTLRAMCMPVPGARQPLQKADLRLGGSGCVTIRLLNG